MGCLTVRLDGASLIVMKVLVAVLLGACGFSTAPPSWLEEHEVDAPAFAGDAVQVVVSSLANNGYAAPMQIAIRWWSGDLLDGATGIEFSCDDIWVWIDDGMRIGGTALAHEIGHCARPNGPDAQHLDREWWGGPVHQAMRALSDTGL